MYKTYKGRVNFLGIAVNDTRPNVLEFIGKYKITYPNTLDPQGDLADRFKLTAHPISLYIAPDGEIVGSHIGGITEEKLKADFERLFGLKP